MKLTCVRCSHTWESRKESPRLCPNCKTAGWKPGTNWKGEAMETVYGVVDRSEYSEPTPRLEIVEMIEGSNDAARFHWGSSCSGWKPAGIFATREKAEEFIADHGASHDAP